jgi:hypothetical protein
MIRYMRRRFYFLLFIIFCLTSLIAPLAKAQVSETAERRQFLFYLGFEDYTREIRERLARGEYEHELNRRQMLRNADMYEVINSSRELALMIFSEFKGRPELLKQFIAKMLAVKPLPPNTAFPLELMQLPMEERNVAAADWMNKNRREQMEDHTRLILADVSELLYGDRKNENKLKLERFYDLVSTIVDRMYLDSLVGQTKYFGRALTALAAREEKLGRMKILNPLRSELKKNYDLHLENFIGDTLVFDNGEGERRVRVENGTMMLTRNLSGESLSISMAALPKDLFYRWKARFKGLVGNIAALPFFVTPEDTKDGITLATRIRDLLSQTMFETGLSHIVYYQVKTDPATGISMSRVIHNYPEPIADAVKSHTNTGGVMMVYPEQVIDRSHHSRVYFGHFNHQKFYETQQKYIREKGYNPQFFPDTIDLKLDSEGHPTKAQAVAKPWKTQISEEEFKEIHGEKNAKTWSTNILHRFTEKLKDFSLRGVVFHWPDPYGFYLIDGAYCSQTGEMGMEEANNIPIEVRRSAWHWLLVGVPATIGNIAMKIKEMPGLESFAERLLDLPKVRTTMELLKIRIIAPSTLVVQDFIKGESVDLKTQTLDHRMSNNYATYVPFKTQTVRDLENLLPRTEERFNRFAHKYIDPTRSFAASFKALEYAYVMRANRNLKTPLSAEAILAEGARRGEAQFKAPLCKRVLL